jgi:hypothetical protein
MTAPDREAAQLIATAREASAASVLLGSQSLADAALSAVRGTTDAQRLIFTVRDGQAPADALFDAAVAVANLRDPERTVAFYRTLQKVLERGHA